MNLIILPIVVPLLTAALCLIAWTRVRIQEGLSLAGSIAQLIAAIALYSEVQIREYVVLQVGGWKAPFGITFIADQLSAMLLVVGAVVGLLVTIHSRSSISSGRVRYGYYPLVQVLILGVSGSFLTGDLFNLFVWFEVLLISSFVLMALGGEKPQLQGAFKYVTINLVASAVFLSALGLLYGTTGALNIAQLAYVVESTEDKGFLVAVAMMFIVSFGIKAGIFPFYFWLPASYHTPPIAVSALFGGLLTKVGIYAMLRLTSLIDIGTSNLVDTALLTLATLTMLLGGFGALVQTDVRRVISFAMLTSIGAMVLGVAMSTSAGYSAAVLYMVHSAFATTALFLIAGAIREKTGTYDLTIMKGLYAGAPLLSLGFAIAACAFAGIPPLSGFFPKAELIRSGLDLGLTWEIGALLFSSFLCIAAFARVWARAFWRPGDALEPLKHTSSYNATAAAVMIVAVFTVLVGSLSEASNRAGKTLFQRGGYIKAVLPEGS